MLINILGNIVNSDITFLIFFFIVKGFSYLNYHSVNAVFCLIMAIGTGISIAESYGNKMHGLVTAPLSNSNHLPMVRGNHGFLS